MPQHPPARATALPDAERFSFAGLVAFSSRDREPAESAHGEARAGADARAGWGSVLAAAIRRRRLAWLGITLLFPPGFYAAQLLLLRIRFGHWPNYATIYDWPANVARIIHATPSIRDIITLVRAEWLFETGYLNHDYGPGIAEWSMTVIPEHLIYVALLGALLATNLVLLLDRGSGAHPASACCAGAATGLGGSLLGLSNVSLTWALCCGSPNWAVALTFLGFGSTSALWLVPYAPVLAWTGLVLLLLPIALLLRERTHDTPAAQAMPRPAP